MIVVLSECIRGTTLLIQPNEWHGVRLIIGLFLTVIGIFIVVMMLDLIRQYIGMTFKKVVE